MGYVYSAIASLVVAVLGFALKEKIKQLKELKEEKAELEKREEDGIREGVLALLRIKLIEYHGRYKEEQKISTHGYENWTLMYKAYKKLGGNGMVRHMNEEIEEMHLR